jgi:hypothetical protein
MRYLFAILLLLSLSGQAQNRNRCCVPLKESLSVKQLGHEFQQLRKYRETDCCRKNLSRMMEVLDRLQDSLNENLTPTQVKNIMGRPDFTEAPKELFIKLNESETLMGYEWRTTDFLYFVFKNDELVTNDWYHSYE